MVEVLIAYNLSYVQEVTSEGQYIYRLDPELEEVAYFPDIPHYSLPYAIKQLVAHEVEVEKMRRKEPSSDQKLTTNPVRAKSETVKQEGQKVEDVKSTNVIPNHLKKLQAKNIHVKERVPVDFFGRKIEKATSACKGNGETKADTKGELVFSDVWFNFKEGFNNAVRRTIRIKDLI